MPDRHSPQGQPDPARNGALAEQLIRRHGARLRRIAAENSSYDEAADALQNALALFIAKFNGEPEAALPWLTTTLKREAWAIAGRRRRDGQMRVGEAVESDEPLVERVASDGGDPHGAVERIERTARARELIGQLRPDERDALALFGAGLSYAEIMALRGWTYTKVNRCINEGRARLRRLVAADDETGPQGSMWNPAAQSAEVCDALSELHELADREVSLEVRTSDAPSALLTARGWLAAYPAWDDPGAPLVCEVDDVVVVIWLRTIACALRSASSPLDEQEWAREVAFALDDGIRLRFTALPADSV